MADERIRPEDIETMCDILIEIHLQKSAMAFNSSYSQQERDLAFNAADTIRECMDKIVGLLMDPSKHTVAKRRILARLGWNDSVAASIKELTAWEKSKEGVKIP